jgi:transcriptional regulator GlxA family with amidase domain
MPAIFQSHPVRATTNVYLVVLPGVMLLDLAGIAEPLRLANRFACEHDAKAPPPFELHIVAATSDVSASLPLTLANVEALPKRLPTTAEDWVILVGVAGKPVIPATRQKTALRATVRWLKEVVRPALDQRRIRLWTVCSGALIAAEAGLLDGRDCTTHHELTSALRDSHPDAKVLEDRIFVIDDRIATSAGVTAGIDLALAAIAGRCGARVAGEVARDMVVYWRRAGGDPQLSPFVAHRNHLHPAVHRAQQAILAAPGEDWSVERIAEAGHVSARHMRRLFAHHADVTPLAYVNAVRVALARQLLCSRRISVEAAAEEVGFASARQLRNAWKKIADDSPHDAKKLRD